MFQRRLNELPHKGENGILVSDKDGTMINWQNEPLPGTPAFMKRQAAIRDTVILTAEPLPKDIEAAMKRNPFIAALAKWADTPGPEGLDVLKQYFHAYYSQGSGLLKLAAKKDLALKRSGFPGPFTEVYKKHPDLAPIIEALRESREQMLKPHRLSPEEAAELESLLWIYNVLRTILHKRETYARDHKKVTQGKESEIPEDMPRSLVTVPDYMRYSLWYEEYYGDKDKEALAEELELYITQLLQGRQDVPWEELESEMQRLSALMKPHNDKKRMPRHLRGIPNQLGVQILELKGFYVDDRGRTKVLGRDHYKNPYVGDKDDRTVGRMKDLHLLRHCLAGNKGKDLAMLMVGNQEDIASCPKDPRTPVFGVVDGSDWATHASITGMVDRLLDSGEPDVAVQEMLSAGRDFETSNTYLPVVQATEVEWQGARYHICRHRLGGHFMVRAEDADLYQRKARPWLKNQS